MTKKQADEDEETQTTFGGPGFWGAMRSQFGNNAPFGRANFGQRGWLRPAILRLLDEKPMSGMEIINKFYEVSHGWAKPSPGSVYPLLEAMEREQVISRRSDGRYELAKAFRSGLKSSGQVEEMLTNMEGTASYLEELARSDKESFTSYKKRIDRLAERLAKLA